MDHFAGLDVSVKETSVCIVDDTGRIVREVKVASEPEALLTALKNPSPRCRSGGGADLSCHRRCACSVPKIQVSRRGIWTDVFQVSIRRDRLERQNITLRR